MPLAVQVTATLNGKPIKIDTDQLPRDVGNTLVRVMNATILEVIGEVQRSTFGKAGLKRRTGNLVRSLTNLGVDIVRRGKKIEVTGAVGVPKGSPGGAYAAIHEFGGTVTAKNAQYLTVPLPAAMTSGGVARGSARDFDNTFVLKSKKGNLLIVQKGEGGSLTPLFVLKKSVTIPKRPYLEPAVRAGAKKRLSEEATDGLIETWKEAFI